MANRIVKKMTITRVAYGLCELVDGEMKYVEKPDLIIKGIRSKEYARKQLVKMYGADANISIKDVDAGEHRFSMSMEDFVRNADVDLEEMPEGAPSSAANNESESAVPAEKEESVPEEAPEAGDEFEDASDDSEDFDW